MARRDIITDRIPEWRLQAAVCADLERRKAAGEPFEYAASLEGTVGGLSRYQRQMAAATGLQAGEPDLRLYFARGRLVFIELKGSKGKHTKSQVDRFPLLEALGHVIHTVEADTEAEMVRLVGLIIDRELAQ